MKRYLLLDFFVFSISQAPAIFFGRRKRPSQVDLRGCSTFKHWGQRFTESGKNEADIMQLACAGK